MGGAAMHPEVEQPKPVQTQTSPPHHNQSNRRGDSHGVHFGKGSLVEVTDEGFRGVYLSATVIHSSISSSEGGFKREPKGLYVEYESLFARGDGSERLREYVDPAFVRPAPPLHETVEGFELDDAVEAFCRRGVSRLGVVSRVLEGGQRHKVTFENQPGEVEFGLAELRAHWDWVDGSWVLPVKQSKAGLMFEVGRKLEVSFDREDSQAAWFTANVREDLGNGAFLVEYCRADADSKPLLHKVTTDLLHIRPCPPLLKNKSFDIFAKVDAFFDYGWWSGFITKALADSRYNVFFKEMKKDAVFELSELRPHMEWKDDKWFTSSQLSQYASGDDVPDNSRSPVSTVPVCNSGERKDISDGKTHSSLTPDVKRLTQDDLKISPATSSPVKRTRRLKSHGSKKMVPWSVRKPKKGSVVGVSEQETPDRSVKESLSSSVSTVSASVSATEAAKGNLSSNIPSQGKRIRVKSRTDDEILYTEESIRLQPLHALKRGKRQPAGEKVALLEKPTSDAEKAVCESANNEFADEPVSKGIEAKQSSFDILKLCAVNTTKNCKENGKKQGNDVVLKEQSEKQQQERGTQASTSLIDEVPLVPIEQQGLPFLKTSTLWKTFESMKIFKKLPKEPHFQPLEQCKIGVREGLAIGYMVTFTSMVEKTSKLQLGDPESDTDIILETLVDLERHGFDVSFLRDRVNELLAVREKREKLVGETRELNTQISKQNQEKNKIEEEKKQLQEKLAVAELGMKNKNDEIALLQATLKEKEEAIKNTGRDFEVENACPDFEAIASSMRALILEAIIENAGRGFEAIASSSSSML